jgi:histidine triad (HIT) family protein
MSPSCTFCQIAAGSIAAPIVQQDERFIAFLDHRPLFAGHVLLIPRTHYETLADLPRETVGPLFTEAQALSRAMEDALGAEGSFVAINNRISQSVPHLHVHIVPRRRQDGLRGFFWPRTKYRNEDEIESFRAKLEAALERRKQPTR